MYWYGIIIWCYVFQLLWSYIVAFSKYHLFIYLPVFVSSSYQRWHGYLHLCCSVPDADISELSQTLYKACFCLPQLVHKVFSVVFMQDWALWSASYLYLLVLYITKSCVPYDTVLVECLACWLDVRSVAACWWGFLKAGIELNIREVSNGRCIRPW